MKAARPVLAWQRAINARWEQALASSAALQQLYLLEAFRSNVLDLLDDLHGQSCTPMTLRKADFALEMLRDHFPLLKAQQALFFGDETATQPGLLGKYQALRLKASTFQLAAHGGSAT